VKSFGGNVLFLKRDNINTDEIIPAKYLTEISKFALKPYLLEDLILDNFDPKKDIENKSVILSLDNFGCGSSREHAPWALEVNDIHVVIASSFARIFKQNMFNCGMLPLTLPKSDILSIFDNFHNPIATCDWVNQKIIFTENDKFIDFPFELSSFEKELIEAGGWVNYADNKY